MRIKLTLNTKNWAVFEGSPFELDGPAVPRVGEIIDVGTSYGLRANDVTTFFVCDVTWDVDEGTLVPHLKCRQWWEGDRQMELQEHGWL